MKLVHAELLLAYDKDEALDEFLIKALNIYCINMLGIRPVIQNKSALRKAKNLMQQIWTSTNQITFGHASTTISLCKSDNGPFTVESEPAFAKNASKCSTIVVYCYPDFIYINKAGHLKMGKRTRF